MSNVELKLNKNGEGHFFINDDKEQLAEMSISVAGNNMTVYHTEVIPKAEGTGLAKKLLTEMVNYARKNTLKVIALCPFVSQQLKKHADEYGDILK